MRKISSTVAVLRRFRELSGKSRVDMARETGIGIRTIERIESGESDMKVSHMERYMSVLGLSHFDLAIAVQTGNYSVSNEMESAAKALPHDIRLLQFQYIVKLAEILNKKGPG